LTTAWTDNCSAGGSINSDGGVDQPDSPDGCTQQRLYTFTVTDSCGNASQETTLVTRVHDMTDPEIIDLADYQLEGCNAEWPAFLTTTWTDNCSAGGSINSGGGVDQPDSPDGCTQRRLYTFTMTDSCGNTSQETTLVTRVHSMTDPEIIDLADYQLEGCNAEWPAFLTTTWTDNCSAGGSVDSDGGVDQPDSPDGCMQHRLYTFTVTDNCGNSSQETTLVSRAQSITNPEIVDLADFTLEGCNAEWPAFLTTTWTDNCSAGGSINSDGGVDQPDSPDGCTQQRLYTFTVTDSCGNSSQETTLVSRVYDMTDPEIIDLADYQLEGCNVEWPAFLTTAWTDNCANGGDIESDNGVDDGVNEDGNIEFRLYTFSVNDNCGNTATETTRVSRIFGGGIEVFSGNISKCITENDEFDLFDYLIGNYDTQGQWQVKEGNITLSGSTFNPSSLLDANENYSEQQLGDYIFTYVTFGACPLEAEVVITINDICVAKGCAGEREITTALTPNNDGTNDTFDTGISLGGDCTVDVQIFNRWGDKIFEAQNYQNDWEGTVQPNAIGSSDKITTGTYYYILRFKVDGELDQTITGYFYAATEN
jgi:gliding motility-associated-like protein